MATRTTAVSRRAWSLTGTVAAGALLVGLTSPAMAADHSMEPTPSHSSDCSPGLVEDTTAPMYAHFEKAHLERSPAQQVSDAQKADDYALIHTVWIENFSAPGRNGVVHIAGETPKPFFAHVQHAHMQRSPGQQVADLKATDDYLLLHTVWAESMLQPTIDVLNGSSCQ